MTTNKILALTLLATTLILNATVVRPKVQNTVKQQTNLITNKIANILYRRGIETDKSKELSQTLVNSDEELFTYMVHTFSQESSIALTDIYDELAKIALKKKSADFSSYSFLVKLTQNIKDKHLNGVELKNIESISSTNKLILQAFV